MASNPRRISKIEVLLEFSHEIAAKAQKILEHTARTCPVDQSLHPDVVREITFKWKS